MDFDCPLCGSACTMRADKKRNPFYSCHCGQHFLRGPKGHQAAINCIGQANLDKLLAAESPPAPAPAKKKPARRKAKASTGAPRLPDPPAPDPAPPPAAAESTAEPEPERRRGTLLG